MRNILFVSHDASRTGAPIVFKHLIQWIKENANLQFSILLLEGGVLEQDFKNLGTTYIWNCNQKPNSVNLLYRFGLKVYKHIFRSEVFVKMPSTLANQKFDLVYVNTVAGTNIIDSLKNHFNCKVLLHVHENDFTIQNYYPNSLNDEIKKNIDAYIAVSQSTRQNLIDKYGLNEDKVNLVYEFVPVESLVINTNNPTVKNQIKSAKEFLVCGAGLTSWRKGADLFVQLAYLLKQKASEGINIKFIWLGNILPEFQKQMDYEIERLNLDSVLTFTGSVKNPEDYFAVIDLFILTSREDPFPLVCLEAASLGKPILCFEDSGGMVEFVNEGAGIAVPYLNLIEMQEKILMLYHDKYLLNKLGEQAKRLVKNYDVSIQAKKIEKIINNLIEC